MEKILNLIYKESQELKNSIELIDFFVDQRTLGKGLLLENLVKKFVNVKVKMYKERHNKPHVHLDIGNQNHSVSIGIENQIVLAGSIERKYEKVVLDWIEKNKTNLLLIWDNIQQGQIFDLSILN